MTAKTTTALPWTCSKCGNEAHRFTIVNGEYICDVCTGAPMMEPGAWPLGRAVDWLARLEWAIEKARGG